MSSILLLNLLITIQSHGRVIGFSFQMCVFNVCCMCLIYLLLTMDVMVYLLLTMDERNILFN